MSPDTLFPTTPFEVRPPQTATQEVARTRSERSTLRQAVRAALLRHPEGLSDWDLCELLGLPERRKGSVGKRRQEVGARPVYVMVDGERRVKTRMSPLGSPCTVWELRP